MSVNTPVSRSWPAQNCRKTGYSEKPAASDHPGAPFFFRPPLPDRRYVFWPPFTNDAARVTKALTPLYDITESGAAVMIVHHPRKTGGANGLASRGSSALPAFADILMDLDRRNGHAGDKQRVLKGLGRFDDTPTEIVIELGGGVYKTVGARSDADQAERLEVIAEVLQQCDSALTYDEVLEAWPSEPAPPGQRTVQKDLNAGYEADRWHRSGSGKRGSPYVYSRKAT